MSQMRKIDICLFIVLLFLQNFALYSNDQFGINGLAIYLILISLLNVRRYYLKVNKKFFFSIIFLIACLISFSLINNVFYFNQIVKTIMQIWLFYVSFVYIKEVYNKGQQDYFWKAYAKILLVFMLYGVYEYIAINNQLPLFLNVFSNNPSYAVRGVYKYYSGWNGEYRLYNVFFEPSIFSLFLVINFFLIKQNKYISKGFKKFLYVLLTFNFIFTYSRTGYVTFIYFLCIYVFYTYFNKKQRRIYDIACLMLPFINLYVMYFIGGTIFSDLSYKLRFNSALYYLNSSFDSIGHILFGHGCGSVVNNTGNFLNYIAASAQNGYSDFLFQFGFLSFIYLFVKILGKFKQITNENKYLIVGTLSVLCCLGNYYMVETMLVLVVLIIIYCEESELKE